MDIEAIDDLLRKRFLSSRACAKTWALQWEKYKDGSAAKNALVALTRYQEISEILSLTNPNLELFHEHAHDHEYLTKLLVTLHQTSLYTRSDL